MAPDKTPYAKHDFKGTFATVKRWQLHAGEQGCTPLDIPGLCVAMDKSPLPLPAPPPPSSAIAAKSLPTLAQGPTLVAAWNEMKGWVEAAAAKPLPPSSPSEGPVLVDAWNEVQAWSATAKLDAHGNPKVPPFDLYDMPAAMKLEGFSRAAKLNSRWLDGRYYVAPISWDEKGIEIEGIYDVDMVDATTVTLGWLLANRSIAGIYDDLIHTGIFNVPALEVLRYSKLPHFFASNPNYKGVINTLEYCGGDLQKLHRSFQFQKGTVGTFDTLSIENVLHAGMTDVTAALGTFALYAAIARAHVNVEVYNKYNAPQGSLRCIQRYVEITHIYIYAKDSYSFFDAPNVKHSQYLGHWNKYGVVIAATRKTIGTGLELKEKSVFHYIDNAKYREWRELHMRGGDFLVFSDLKLVKLDKPIQVKMDEVCV